VKASLGTLAAIAALSLAVWTAFTLLMPAEPLSPAETVVIVGGSGAVVLGVKWAWQRFRDRSGRASQ
jgi:NADPH:quinone reductase-like Zn-dependent oxidoreductase